MHARAPDQTACQHKGGAALQDVWLEGGVWFKRPAQLRSWAGRNCAQAGHPASAVSLHHANDLAKWVCKGQMQQICTSCSAAANAMLIKHHQRLLCPRAGCERSYRLDLKFHTLVAYIV
jgi:hypothetical protein